MKGFNIDKFVSKKIDALSNTDKTFKSIYELMFKDKDFVMFEYIESGRVKKLTYEKCKEQIERMSVSLKEKLSAVEKGKMVGLYAQNSIEWIQIFWAILKCGYKPLLMNTKLSKERLEQTLKSYDVGAVISDGETFEKKTVLIEDIEKNLKIENEINDWENELIVMSSGTTLKSKLCVYDGESFYYQLCDSANIIKECKAIKKHYEGSIKQLMFLPLYHIFGLAAMFMWFAFFSRTFVILKDQNPETIMFTIRKHKVTHIFAVPLFWEIVYKQFQAGLKQMDEKTNKKFNMGMKLARKFKSLGLGKLLFKQVREKLFGESICFLITGGGVIAPEILEFFNIIGYRLANGYGMSEVGITSVELSADYKNLTDGAVGKPFSHIEYKINDNGELLIKGGSTAKEVYVDGQKEVLRDNWYNTHDMVKETKGRYFICGRQDDLIIGSDGENINPAWTESLIKLEDCEGFCILKMKSVPTLLIQVKKFVSLGQREKIKEKARQELLRLNVANVVKNIVFTNEPLISGNEFKINRIRLANVSLVKDKEEKQSVNCDNEIIKEVRNIFAKVLNISPDEISDKAHFFFDLNGSSLDYFSLLSTIQAEFNVTMPKEKTFYTVSEFYRHIEKNV